MIVTNIKADLDQPEDAMPDDTPFHLRCGTRTDAALAGLRALLPWRLTRCIPMEVYRAA